MKNRHVIVISCIAAAVTVLGGLGVYLLMTPIVVLDGGKPGGDIFEPQTQVGRIFASVSECAHKQKGLFGYVEAYKEKHGQIPDSLKTLIDDDNRSMSWTHCPLGHLYVIHPENYGKPNAVFISESRNEHPSALKLWLRGIKPCVQTMGEGTIHMFEDGKVATIQARKN